MSKTRTSKTWIMLADGTPFDFADIPGSVDRVSIEVIAHALSRIPRFGGHCDPFWSVAQHSILCSFFADSKDQALDALMHDAAEAVIGDVVSPLKHMLRDYRRIESKIEKCLADRFGYRYGDPAVKRLDMNALWAEARYIRRVGDPCKDWGLEAEYEPSNPRAWLSRIMLMAETSKEENRQAFLAYYRRLSRGD